MKKNIFSQRFFARSITLLFLIFSLLLSSCGKPEQELKINEKKSFPIEVTQISDFENTAFIEKSGTLKGAQNIVLSSQAQGRVSSIVVKEGQSVKKGQPLVYLYDDIGNYNIQLDRTANAISRAKINYDSMKLSLDSAVFNAQQNLKNIQGNLVATKKNYSSEVAILDNSTANSDYKQFDSESALQLEKLDNTIAKLELDYENKLRSDTVTLESFSATFEREYDALSFFLNDVIRFTDEVLGVTEENKDKNNSYDYLLGVRDSTQKSEAKQVLRDIIQFEENNFQTIEVYAGSSDDAEKELFLAGMSEGYDLLRELLNGVEEVLNNSRPSVGTFDQTTIDGLLSQTNLYQGTYQQNYSAFIATDTQIDTFLKTYEGAQKSLQKQIELTKKDREILLKNLETGNINSDSTRDKTVTTFEDNIAQLQRQVDISQRSLNDAKLNRDIQLKSLQNAIYEAQISYREASKNAGKLIVRAPITGTIGEIQVDVGQELAPGIQTLNMAGEGKKEVEVYFSYNEVFSLEAGQRVNLKYQGESFEGELYSISKIANQNLQFKGNIIFDTDLPLLGGVVEISLPFASEYSLLPLDMVKITGNGVGEISVIHDEKLEKIRIQLGDIFGDSVEFIGFFDEGYEESLIILSDMNSYDAEKYFLEIDGKKINNNNHTQ